MLPDQSVLSAREILDTKYPDQEFVIGPSLLPRGGALIVGAATGVGKSLLAIHLAQCLATGNPLFGATYNKHGLEKENRFPVAKLSKIIYIDYELPDQLRKTRLSEPLDNLLFPVNPTLYGLDAERFGNLKELVGFHKPDMLIIDPLSSAHTYNENTNELKIALNRLDYLRKEYGLTGFLLHHASSKIERDKEKKEVLRKPIEMFRGHTCLVDWADLAIALYRIGDEWSEDDEEHDAPSTVRLAFAKHRYTSHRKPLKISVNFKKKSISLL